MKYVFTEEDIKNGVNKIELEGEDVTLIGEYIESVEDQYDKNLYKITGNAIIEGEVYHEFTTMFATIETIDNPTAKKLAESEWDWYDYIID